MFRRIGVLLALITCAGCNERRTPPNALLLGDASRRVTHTLPKVYAPEKAIDHECPVVNNTDKVVVISKLLPSCGCSNAILDRKEFKPGDQGTLRVSVDTKDRSGPQAFNCSIFAEGDDTPWDVTLKTVVEQPYGA